MTVTKLHVYNISHYHELYQQNIYSVEIFKWMQPHFWGLSSVTYNNLRPFFPSRQKFHIQSFLSLLVKESILYKDI